MPVATERYWTAEDVRQLPEDGNRYDDIVQPDLFVARVRPDAPVPWNWPDITGLALAIEVLSPSTASHDRITKRTYYQRIGVDEYRIVDLDARLIERWRPDDDRPEILTASLVWEPRTDASLALDLAAFFKAMTGER